MMSMDSHIEQILWSQDSISLRVTELAAQLTSDFKDADPPPVFVAVATGAFLFVADLVRRIDLPIAVDFVRAESYGSGTESNGAPTVSLDLKVDVNGKHVILEGYCQPPPNANGCQDPVEANVDTDGNSSPSHDNDDMLGGVFDFSEEVSRGNKLLTN